MLSEHKQRERWGGTKQSTRRDSGHMAGDPHAGALHTEGSAPAPCPSHSSLPRGRCLRGVQDNLKGVLPWEGWWQTSAPCRWQGRWDGMWQKHVVCLPYRLFRSLTSAVFVLPCKYTTGTSTGYHSSETVWGSPTYWDRIGCSWRE